ncbi:hypothetical protein [Actinoplanes lobatus]|nr:hypothetical protein [Actinoplanes lobatus]MBB4747742.1 hypothetical protein [Actinoplanes lobatus]
MLPVFIEKTDAAGRGTTTMSADPDLVLPVPANSKWWIEMHLLVAGTNTAKVRTSWGAPTGATGLRRCLGPGSTTAAQTDADISTSRFGVHALGTAITYGLPRNNNTLLQQIIETAQITIGATAGNIALVWGQAAADTANVTYVSAGSLIKAYRLA